MSADELQAFEDLKRALVTDPVLWPHQPLRPQCVKSDASLFGLGAVLVQHDDDNNEHPIVYASRKLPLERNFSTIEKETLAVVWALKTFERYIYGVHTTVEIDHNCPRWLNTISIQNPRLTTWPLALQKYDIAEVKYKKGIMHTDCDGLSRIMFNV